MTGIESLDRRAVTGKLRYGTPRPGLVTAMTGATPRAANETRIAELYFTACCRPVMDDILILKTIQRLTESLAHVGVHLRLDFVLSIRTLDMIPGDRNIYLEGSGYVSVGIVALAISGIECL
jgi:hypothetical protein